MTRPSITTKTSTGADAAGAGAAAPAIITGASEMFSFDFSKLFRSATWLTIRFHSKESCCSPLANLNLKCHPLSAWSSLNRPVVFVNTIVWHVPLYHHRQLWKYRCFNCLRYHHSNLSAQNDLVFAGQGHCFIFEISGGWKAAARNKSDPLWSWKWKT